MLILGRKAGESLTIGGDISITVLSVDSGGNVSLGIQAPKEMLILSLIHISEPTRPY